MQVDINIRFCQLLLDNRKKSFIEGVFIVFQCFSTEYQRFDKVVVADCFRLEEVSRVDFVLKLCVPVGEEGKLHREGVPVGFLVKFGKERIFSELFEDEFRIGLFRQPCCQGGFPGTDISFYDQVIEIHVRD